MIMATRGAAVDVPLRGWCAPALASRPAAVLCGPRRRSTLGRPGYREGKRFVTIDQELLDHLAAFDTPTICNALEVVQNKRLTVGFTSTQMVCAFPDMKPIVGFARTATIKAATPTPLPPAEAKALRVGYYEYLVKGAQPVITVIQDLDPDPGFGAFWGEVNTAVHRGLGVHEVWLKTQTVSSRFGPSDTQPDLVGFRGIGTRLSTQAQLQRRIGGDDGVVVSARRRVRALQQLLSRIVVTHMKLEACRQ